MCAAAVAALGTANLWKAGATNLFPVDPTGAAIVAVLLLTLGAALKAQRSPAGSLWPVIVAFTTFIPGVWSSNAATDYSQQKSRGLFTVVLLCVLGASKLLQTTSRRAAFVVITAGIGILTSFFIVGSGSVGLSGRATIGEANPIALGRLAAMAFVVMAIAALRLVGTARYASGAAAVLAAVAAVSTGSRGPAVTAALAVVVVAVASSARRRLHMTVALTTLVLGGWQASLRWAPSSATSRIANGDHGGATSSGQRERLIAEAIGTAGNHPFGVGWGHLAAYLDRSAFIAEQGEHQYPHNVLAEAAAEGGVIALGGLLLLLTISAVRLLQNRGDLVGQALIGLWIHAVGSAMTSSDLTGNRMMWVMVGAGLVAERRTPLPGISASSKTQSRSGRRPVMMPSRWTASGSLRRLSPRP